MPRAPHAGALARAPNFGARPNAFPFPNRAHARRGAGAPTVGDGDESAPRFAGINAAPHYIRAMCGRVIQSSGPLRYAIVDGVNVRDSRVHNYPPRWNAAPSQDCTNGLRRSTLN